MWFIASENPALLPDQFSGLAAALGLPIATDPASLRVTVHQGLQEIDRWLLIFDNAEDAEISGRGSRRSRWRRGGSAMRW